MTDISLDEIVSEFQEVRSLLDAFLDPAAPSSGQDLTVLDRKISAFCEKVSHLPAKQARQFAEPLQVAIRDLDTIAGKFQELAQSANPGPSQSRHQAAKAYGKKPAY